MARKKLKDIAGIIGWFIIIGSHLFILPFGLSQDDVMIHAISNLFAVGLIIWSFGGINKFRSLIKL